MTRSNLCSEITTVSPRSWTKRWRIDKTSSAAIGSRAEVGSSRTRTLGCITSALPIATRCCSPPLSVDIERPRKWARESRSRISSTRLRMTSGAKLRASMPKTSSSSTVSVTKPCTGFCPTIPMRWARPPGFVREVEIPSTEISPANIPPVWCGTNPLINRSREDFPEPVAPMTRTISPSSIVKERSSKTVCSECG